TGVAFDWDYRAAGLDAAEKYGSVLPEEVLDSVRANKVAIKGPITTPRGGGFRSVNVALRKMLDLYACLRPAKNYPGVRSRYQNIDLVIVRENHEDLYAGVEFEKGDPAIQKIGELTDAAGMGRIGEDAGLSPGLVGGLGAAPGANLGDEIALFEPVHGSAPKYAGQNKVNPMALMLSGVMMLRHIAETDTADRMEHALAAVIAEGKSVTY